MALLTASVACAGEWALDALVRAISLVVADLSTVEALSGQAAALGLVGAVSREVIGLSAAVA
jgi:hypothetical protein